MAVVSNDAAICPVRDEILVENGYPPSAKVPLGTEY